jgi:hypothetical protein
MSCGRGRLGRLPQVLTVATQEIDDRTSRVDNRWIDLAARRARRSWGVHHGRVLRKKREHETAMEMAGIDAPGPRECRLSRIPVTRCVFLSSETT